MSVCVCPPLCVLPCLSVCLSVSACVPVRPRVPVCLCTTVHHGAPRLQAAFTRPGPGTAGRSAEEGLSPLPAPCPLYRSAAPNPRGLPPLTPPPGMPPGSPRSSASPAAVAGPRRGQSAAVRHGGTPSSRRRGQSTHRTRRAPLQGAGRGALTHGGRVIDASGVAKFSRWPRAREGAGPEPIERRPR